MKKTSPKKLTMKRETIRTIAHDDLVEVNGGYKDWTSASDNQGPCCRFCAIISWG